MHLTTNQGILICVIVVAFSALSQAIALGVIAAGALRTRKRMRVLAEQVEQEVLPAVRTVRGILEDTSPKVKQVADEMLEVSRTVRRQVDHMDEALTDIVNRTQTQATRVDECMTMVLGGLSRAGGKVQQATGGTSRKVGAVMTGIRVGMEVLRARRKAREASRGKG